MRLETARLVLREMVPDDWRALLAIETPAVVRYMSQDAATEASARAYVDDIVAAARVVPRVVFDLAITLRGDDAMLGRCGMKLEDDGRNAMLWFVIHPAHQGNGYVTEASRAIVGFAFEHLRVHRVYGDCDPRNLASVRVLEKLAMRREAHLVENVWLKGEWCDSLIYAILDREWA